MMRRKLSSLSPHTKRRLRSTLSHFRSLFRRANLTKLAAIYGTDKLSHGYMTIYQRHFQRLKRQKINLLEIGIGGYNDPWSGGGSLQMWAAYFACGHVYGADIDFKHRHASRRITVLQGDQFDPAFLSELAQKIIPLHIVIDDGSHKCSDVIASFEGLFPHLCAGGVYVIEDTQTSYWDLCGGSMDVANTRTTMNYFKALADGLNYAEYTLESYEPSYFDLNILSIHFYHNLIFIEKGANTLKSNVALKDRQTKAETH